VFENLTFLTVCNYDVGEKVGEFKIFDRKVKKKKSVKVFNAICQIKSNATSMDDVPIKFLKILLPQALSYITHIFNTILTTSI
jgi:hypothetical protein